MSPAPRTAGTPYAEAHEAGRTALRKLILDTASRLLEADGPDALTMRRIAGEVGCSTTVLYTMFGGKPGIAEALWREGFARLAAAFAQVGEPEPLARLRAIGETYRVNALANRSYYAVMFQRPIPGFEPSEEAYRTSLEPLQILTDAVRGCIDAGVFRPEDPEHIAGVLWAAVHGSVSLELAGYAGARDADARFATLMASSAAWFRP